MADETEPDIDALLPYILIDKEKGGEKKKVNLREPSTLDILKTRIGGLENRVSHTDAINKSLDEVTEESIELEEEGRPVNPVYGAEHERLPDEMFVTREQFNENYLHRKYVREFKMVDYSYKTRMDALKDIMPLRTAIGYVEKESGRKVVKIG
jgi:hypothetical protein